MIISPHFAASSQPPILAFDHSVPAWCWALHPSDNMTRTAAEGNSLLAECMIPPVLKVLVVVC